MLIAYNRRRTTRIPPPRKTHSDICSNARAEIFILRHREPSACACLTTAFRIVAPPVDRKFIVANGEENDNTGDGDGCWQGGRQNVVVLGPEGEVSAT